MPSSRTVFNKTFALTSQQHEGTVALLDVRVEAGLDHRGELTTAVLPCGSGRTAR
ncbi:hypothetical protein DAPPUDRAFT_276539 [Daphnia pulex]|uniref:Uncharacterized protein n=1 Tax=Daphnia pulex TaxID=6669 RepID=E9I5X4_DAPPU|nr:hypothetical protein DAPPUDRAFT_276539 [Daphnia pulex]|eukprot:EFX60606.1 hypothetical protein DAPPUDRAFT_276539 [Daphnia pulex]